MGVGEAILKHYPKLTHAFILLGITNIDACARNKTESKRINVDAICRLLADLSAAGIQPIFTSTDVVFDGTKGNYTEEDPTSPLLTYGAQKVAVEQYLASLKTPWAVVRLSKVVDPQLPPGDWLGDWVSKLEAGEEVCAARDQVYSPISAEEVAEGLVRLAEENAHGMFHLGGPNRCSRLHMLEYLMGQAAPHLPPGFTARITPCSIRDFPFLEPRPLDTSLCSEKLSRRIQFKFSGLKALCEQIIDRRYRLVDR
jgi:dTDP-4-dehydrorhamnose reductase